VSQGGVVMHSHIIWCIGVLGVLLMGLLAWGKQPRQFVVLGTGDVLDERTSLRWQQTPGAPGNMVSSCDKGNACTWQEATDYCEGRGNGSRLPEKKELMSLLDNRVPSPAPFLAAGHPFQKVESAFYWSAMANASSLPAFWDVVLETDDEPNGTEAASFHAWCVR